MPRTCLTVDGETARHRAVFEEFYRLGPHRKFTELSRRTGTGLRSLKKWCATFNWYKRIAERDAEARVEKAAKALASEALATDVAPGAVKAVGIVLRELRLLGDMAPLDSKMDPRKAAFLHAYWLTMGNFSEAAKMAQVHRRSVYSWLSKGGDPEFTACFIAIREARNDWAESRLLQHIHDGNLQALMFYLKANHPSYATADDALRVYNNVAVGVQVTGQQSDQDDAEAERRAVSVDEVFEAIASIPALRDRLSQRFLPGGTISRAAADDGGGTDAGAHPSPSEVVASETDSETDGRAAA